MTIHIPTTWVEVTRATYRCKEHNEENFDCEKKLKQGGKREDVFMKILLCRSKSSASKSEVGIALVTTLLLLILLSALSIAFVLAVNTENRLQGGDRGNTKAYYGAEGAMEKMVIDLNTLYTQQAAPSVSDITGLGCPPPMSTCPTPSINGISYSEYLYNVTPDPTNSALPQQYESNIQSGPNQGLIAGVIPIGLSVTANTGTN